MQSISHFSEIFIIHFFHSLDVVISKYRICNPNDLIVWKTPCAPPVQITSDKRGSTVQWIGSISEISSFILQHL